METGIHIGSNKQTVAEARAAINDILRAEVDHQVKLEALKTLTTICAVTNTSISGCTFKTA